MEKEIELSKEAEVKVEIKDAKFMVSGSYEGKLGGAELKLFVPVDAVLDAIAAKIPGQIDDQVIALIKVGLKAI